MSNVRRHEDARSPVFIAEPSPLEHNASIVFRVRTHTDQGNGTEKYLSACVATRHYSIAAPITGNQQHMNTTRLIAIVLIVAGILGLVYGGFSYTKDTTAVKLGPIELSVKEKQQVNVPMWAGIGAIVIGGLLLVLGSKRG